MAEAGYQIIDHMADVAVQAWAPDMPRLIEQAAMGMINLMVARTPPSQRDIEVRGTGDTPEELLIDCLREILLLMDLEGLMPVSVKVLEASDNYARCRVGVVPLTAVRDELLHDIKAVTYHDIDIRHSAGGLVVEVVFDT